MATWGGGGGQNEDEAKPLCLRPDAEASYVNTSHDLELKEEKDEEIMIILRRS